MGPSVLIGRDKRREMPREGPDKGVEAEPGSSGKGIVKLPTSARFSPWALSARVSVSRHT